ncbi:hypothetical protein H8E07_14555 [bacterium]|nr:hypothetical protein [bacterium]
MRDSSSMNEPVQVPVPEHWTPDEAIVIHELIEDLLSAIWRVHGTAIARRYAELAAAARGQALPDEDFDEIPF